MVEAPAGMTRGPISCKTQPLQAVSPGWWVWSSKGTGFAGNKQVSLSDELSPPKSSAA